MSKTDLDPLGDGFKWRLRAELNRITPRYSPPRYLSPAPLRFGAWRLATAALAAGILGTLGLTAYAATGSANPVVWTQQVVTKMGPGEPETASPSAEPSDRPASPEASEREAQPSSRPGATEKPEPEETSRPPASPEPRESPEPGTGGPSPGDH